MKLTKSRLKKIIREEIQKLNEISKEKVDVEIIAKKMAKEKKWFGPSWAKAIRKKYKNGVSERDLQNDLPDYIEGGAISKLFN
jgi:hypothetical protein